MSFIIPLIESEKYELNQNIIQSKLYLIIKLIISWFLI